MPLLFPCGTVKGEILPKMLKDRGDDGALACGTGHPPRSAPSGLPGAFAVRVQGWLCGAPRKGWAALMVVSGVGCRLLS